MLILKCASCHGLTPKPRNGSSFGQTEFHQLGDIERSARAGCPQCQILIDSIPETEIKKTRRHTASAILKTEYRDGSAYRVELTVRSLWQREPPIFNVDLYGIFGMSLALTKCFANLKRVEMSLILAAEAPNPWGLTATNPRVPPPASLGDVAEKALSWINHCKEAHPKCRRDSNPCLPTRILDLLPQGDRVYLVETKEEKRPKRPYACLSYCWGSSQSVKTTRENLDKNKQGIEISLLPRTIREAIELCRHLEIRYLWVDVLCIIQDDSTDWEAESVRMAEYYGGSEVTIAATAAENAQDGLFVTDRSTKVWSKGGYRWATSTSGHANLLAQPTPPLLRRGWVFQERLLAPRVLHCGLLETVLECDTATKCDCIQGATETRWGGNKRIAAGLDLGEGNKWHRLIEKYSELKLSIHSDILPAFSGLAEFSRPEPRTEVDTPRGKSYLAGLWRDSLLSDLLWRVRDPGPLSSKFYPPRAPSWSWASIQGVVRYYDTTYQREQCHIQMEGRCEIEAADTDLAGSSETGEVRSGYVVLRGPLFSLNVGAGKLSYLQVYLDYEQPVHSAEIIVQAFSVGLVGKDYLQRHCLLLLQPTEPTTTASEDSVYERVGYAQMWKRYVGDWTALSEATRRSEATSVRIE